MYLRADRARRAGGRRLTARSSTSPRARGAALLIVTRAARRRHRAADGGVSVEPAAGRDHVRALADAWCALDARERSWPLPVVCRKPNAICAKRRPSIRRRGTTWGRCWPRRDKRGEAIDNFTAFIAQPAAGARPGAPRARPARGGADEGRPVGRGGGAVSRDARAPPGRRARRCVLLAQITLPAAPVRGSDPAVPQGASTARPADVPALGGLGISLASSGRLDEAIAIFRRALDLDPQNIATRSRISPARCAARS